MDAAAEIKEHLKEGVKLKPQHERIILLLGAIAGIIGLVLLMKSHSSSSAAPVSAGISSAGVSSSAGAYDGTLPYGTSQQTSDLLAALQSAGTGVTSAGSTAAPTTAAPTTTGALPANWGSSATGPIANSPSPAAASAAAGAIPYVAPNLLPGPQPAAATTDSSTHLLDSGNTTYNINSTTNTDTTTNIIDSGNTYAVGGNNSAALGAYSSSGNTLPASPGGVSSMLGGAHLPFIGGANGIVIPPPVGITPTEPTVGASPLPGTSYQPAAYSGPVATPKQPVTAGLMYPGGGAGPENKYGPGGALVKH